MTILIFHQPIHQMMFDLRDKGYVLSGSSNLDAFERLYDKVDLELKQTANSTSGVWLKDLSQGNRFNDRTVKKAVVPWEITKNEFAALLNRFWNLNKDNKFVDVKLAITNFLTNSEGLKKPSFFQMFSSKSFEYTKRANAISMVVYNFLKPGCHKLK